MMQILVLVLIIGYILLSKSVDDSISIPIIDISSLMIDQRSYDDMVITASLIDKALQTYGLFVAINHNSKITDNEAMSSSNILYSLSLEGKMEVKMDDSSFARGYIPMGKESGLIDKYYEPKEGIVTIIIIVIFIIMIDFIITIIRFQLWFRK